VTRDKSARQGGRNGGADSPGVLIPLHFYFILTRPLQVRMLAGPGRTFWCDRRTQTHVVGVLFIATNIPQLFYLFSSRARVRLDAQDTCDRARGENKRWVCERAVSI